MSEFLPESEPAVHEESTRAWLQTLYEANDWEPLVTESRRAMFEGRDPDLARLMLATAYARTGRSEEAERLFRELQDGPVRSAVLLHRAFVLTESDPWLAVTWLDIHERDFPDHLASEWRAGAQARLRLAVGDVDTARHHLPVGTLPDHVPKRHPWLGALGSAVLPGFGQLVAGQPVEAGSAFAVVGSLGAGTAWAIAEERYGTAAVVGAVAALFWAGNVYGGGDAAVRWNRHQMGLLQAQLDERGVPGGAAPPVLLGESSSVRTVETPWQPGR